MRTRTTARPSWGTRRSVTSMPLMTLMRLVREACSSLGMSNSLWSTPSIRIRTSTRVAWGSMWISEARSEMPRSMMLFTRRTDGAALASSASSVAWATAVPVLPSRAISCCISRTARLAPSVP